jgi:excisionase family DNA binding protein
MPHSQFFSSFTLDELKSQVSQEVIDRITPLLQSVKTPSPPTDFITRKEASKLLGVSLPTLNDWTKTGKIVGYRISSRVRYKRNELENAMAKIRTK